MILYNNRPDTKYLHKRLGSISLLNSCTPEQLKHIVQISNIKTYHKNQMIIKEGDYSDAFFFIISGSVKVYTKDKKGKVTVLAQLEEDDYFGEQGYLNNLIRTSNVKANSDVELLEIDYDLLTHIFKQSEKLKQFFKTSTFGKCVANLQAQLHSIDSYVKKEIFFSKSDQSNLIFYKKGEVIFTKGDKAEFVYFISSGSVSLEFENNGIVEPVTINKNHLFGELGVMGNKQRMATAKALTNVTLIAIRGKDFLNATRQTIGLRSLVTAYEHVYTLPKPENITEQFISEYENSEAIFTKYKLPKNKIVLCATAIKYPIFTMEVLDVKPDQTFQIITKQGKLIVGIKNHTVISIMLSGETPMLNQLCELLLNEVRLPDANKTFFNRYMR